MALSTKKSNDKRPRKEDDKEKDQPPKKKLIGADNEELKALDVINDPLPPAPPAPVRYYFNYYSCMQDMVRIPLAPTLFELLPRELLPLVLRFALEAVWNHVYNYNAVYIEVARIAYKYEYRYALTLDRYIPIGPNCME